MKKSLLVLGAIAFQVISVAMIAGSKERVLATGQEITLQTAPIDPRDIFRGDYVRLNYLFSQISARQLDDSILDSGLRKGQKVYLSLATDSNGITQGNRLFTSPPADGLYLTGRVKLHWPYRNYVKNKRPEIAKKLNQPVHIKYGIEQYYVEQGKGLVMEEIRGNRNSFQVPMLIHAALSKKGDAVIGSFDWANIAMKTEIINSPERDAPGDEASATIRFTLKNRSAQPITLPWKPNGCSFTLEPVASAPVEPGSIMFQQPGCDSVSASSKTLAPNEEFALDYNLNLPQWQVMYKEEKTPMGKLPWEYRFRIVYNSEDTNDANAMIISRAFHGSGNID